MEDPEDQEANLIAHQNPFDVEAAMAFVRQSSYVGSLHPESSYRAEPGRHYMFGACQSEGRLGLSRYCKLQPGMSTLIARIARDQSPGFSFSLATLSVNAATCPFPQATSNDEARCMWIPLSRNREDGRPWTAFTQGSQVSGEIAVVKIGNQVAIGQLHDITAPVRVAGHAMYGKEKFEQQATCVAIMVGQHMSEAHISSKVRQALVAREFALAKDCGKGGDHNHVSVSVLEQHVCKQSHFGSSHQVAGPGEGLNKREVVSKQSHFGSSHQVAGPGESQETTEVVSEQSHFVSSHQVAGPGEGQASMDEPYGHEHFCKICETVESMSLDGVCISCGCKTGIPRMFSVQDHGKGDLAPQNQYPKSNKNCISKTLKNGTPVYKKESVMDEVLDESGPLQKKPSSLSDDELVVGCVAVPVMESSRLMGEAFQRGRVVKSKTGAQGLHEGAACKVVLGCGELDWSGRGNGEAEGGSNDLPEDARPPTIPDKHLVWDELHFGAVSDGTDCESEDRESGAEEERDGSWNFLIGENVESEATAHLKMLRHSDESRNVTQGDIQTFAEWLDERQVRLASMHEEQLQAWINDSPPRSETERQGREEMQRLWHDVEDLRCELRSLCTEQLVQDVQGLVEQSAGASDDEETVLQTRILANSQVMSEWELWKPCTVVELNGLIQDKEALEHSNQGALDQLQAQGFRITMIPSKVIYSLKAPCGRRKCRLVACGNFLGAAESDKREHKQVVYTASIGIESLRAGLSYSVRRQHTLISIDIKAAFLNAKLLPRSRQEAEVAAGLTHGVTNSATSTSSGAKEVVALIPPRMLISTGFFGPKDRLIVRKAVYGLDQAPRDWGLLRDSTLNTLKIACGPARYQLYQSYSEDNLWLISREIPKRGFEATESSAGDEVEGWLAIYVDDVLVAAKEPLAWATVTAIRECWECSNPEELKRDNNRPIRFLGMDLRWDSDGNLTLDQEAYIKELGARYESEIKQLGRPSTPLSGSFNEDDIEQQQELSDIRSAQALIGELLWTSIRTSAS